MKITVYAIGKLARPYWRAAQQDYLDRLRRYTALELRELKDIPARSRSRHEMQQEESRRLQEQLPEGVSLIVLDRRGRQMSSEELAQFLESHRLRGTRRLAFAVGGPFGFSQELREQANLVLSFSKMTLPHELARIVLLEQLYRAFTILKGEKYHK